MADGRFGFASAFISLPVWRLITKIEIKIKIEIPIDVCAPSHQLSSADWSPLPAEQPV